MIRKETVRIGNYLQRYAYNVKNKLIFPQANFVIGATVIVFMFYVIYFMFYIWKIIRGTVIRGLTRGLETLSKITRNL